MTGLADATLFRVSESPGTYFALSLLSTVSVSSYPSCEAMADECVPSLCADTAVVGV